jgi:hypothetical protein
MPATKTPAKKTPPTATAAKTDATLLLTRDHAEVHKRDRGPTTTTPRTSRRLSTPPRRTGRLVLSRLNGRTLGRLVRDH